MAVTPTGLVLASPNHGNVTVNGCAVSFARNISVGGCDSLRVNAQDVP